MQFSQESTCHILPQICYFGCQRQESQLLTGPADKKVIYFGLWAKPKILQLNISCINFKIGGERIKDLLFSWAGKTHALGAVSLVSKDMYLAQGTLILFICSSCMKKTCWWTQYCLRFFPLWYKWAPLLLTLLLRTYKHFWKRCIVKPIS